MSKYAELVTEAAAVIRKGTPVGEARELVAHQIFPNQPASRAKGCPKCAFLGFAEEALIKGVPGGNYTKSQSNKAYATKALSLLRRNPTLADASEALWQQVMEGNEKQHNQQMNVVIGLWKNGDLV